MRRSFLRLNGEGRRASQGARKIAEQTATPARLPSEGPEAFSQADWLLLAVAFPAVLINIRHGQNGFLTAALLGGALAVLERRPLLAGILFGLLAYKPRNTDY